MVTLVIATHNKGKVKEFREMLEDCPVEVKSLLDYPQCPEVVEDGNSFEENAIKKAETIKEYTGEMVLADDSGLEVDYLEGKPGIYSARFAGEGAGDEENNNKLLNLLQGVPPEDRGAQFTCVIAISSPERETVTVKGICRGIITDAPRGEMGFGYDPLFLVPAYGKTFSELEPEIKNRISHRGKAMEKAARILREILQA
ncbi:MAG: XTP/dITP diphosphatase [Candidatus Syntrophonatronum acetioxidans]|uniref:dITP/XTP pyrophosphatase n=1 Tax=Candidatus Syntrophonatronum acetioxidans TaxID=1795816 RepID=A0A424YGH5_9FIRM|nr:MAG: XTP/dITP diphosphatase [Candidatus Syntrophonatronum acetioxidans]